MAERAAHLLDSVLPRVPVRPWVLSLPYWLRYRLAYDHKLCRAVLGVFVRALLGFYRRQARQTGIADGRSGTVTAIQRFASGLRLNVHFHTAALDGVFVEDPNGELRFVAAQAPTDQQVAELLTTVRSRILRLLERRGQWTPDGDGGNGEPCDSFALESPTLAGICSASVAGRVALGQRAGRQVLRVGSDPNAPWVTSRRPRQAHLEGFDLHADAAVPANDRERLERTCRYALRPPVSQERLELLPDGRVLLRLKAEWSDGTSHLVFTPVELLEKLTAILPRPRINLIIYHGLLAPNARLRARVVAYGRPPASLDVPSGAPAQPAVELPKGPTALAGPKTRHNYSWAELMARCFGSNVLECPHCGGTMRLVATIDDPKVVRKILKHLGMPTEVPEPRSARAPPAEPAQLVLGA